MQKRERILLLVTVAAVLLWMGWPTIDGIFFAPISESRGRLKTVDDNLTKKLGEAAKINQAGKTLNAWRGRSLPPNPLDAQRLYQVWLTDLAQMADLDEPKVTPGRRVPKGNLYSAVMVSLNAKAKLSELSKFLYYFYRIDLPHRIVSLNIDSAGNTGDPTLTISLTAEALAFFSAPKRQYLFPQTTLKEGFRSSRTGEETIELADMSTFPKKPGFRIQIGREYLTVTAIKGNSWTVSGGADSTSPDRHDKDDVVELAPIHPDYAGRSFDDFQQLVQNGPFAKPSLKPRSPSPRPDRSPVARQDNSAAETWLGGAIDADGELQAWLYRRSRSEKTLLLKGTKLDVGEIHAVVLDIQLDHVLLKNGEGVFRLEMGDHLTSWRKLPKEAVPASGRREPADADPKADASGSPEPVAAPNSLPADASDE